MRPLVSLGGLIEEAAETDGEVMGAKGRDGKMVTVDAIDLVAAAQRQLYVVDVLAQGMVEAMRDFETDERARTLGDAVQESVWELCRIVGSAMRALRDEGE